MVCSHYKPSYRWPFLVKGRVWQFQPSRNRKVFCTPSPALLPREHAFCALMAVELGQLLSCCRCSAECKRGFSVTLCCRDNELFLRAFQTPPGIYFIPKFDLLFWHRCLLDWGYAWCLNLSLLDLADGCRMWSRGFVWVPVVLFWSIWLLYSCGCINANLFR